MSNSNNLSNNEELLKLVEKFSFKFFGYDEGNNTLVITPNGQIVLLSVAYNFVKQQMAKSAQNIEGGIESIPQMPSLPQPEGKIEKDVEKKIEVQGEKSQPINIPKNNDLQVQTKSPQMPILAKEPENPYGDSPKLSFNPANISKVEDYVNKNSRKTKASTARWLSEQFRKFIEEQKLIV